MSFAGGTSAEGEGPEPRTYTRPTGRKTSVMRGDSRVTVETFVTSAEEIMPQDRVNFTNLGLGEMTCVSKFLPRSEKQLPAADTLFAKVDGTEAFLMRVERARMYIEEDESGFGILPHNGFRKDKYNSSIPADLRAYNLVKRLIGEII